MFQRSFTWLIYTISKFRQRYIKPLCKTNPSKQYIAQFPTVNKLANLSVNHCFVLSLTLIYILWHFVIAGECWLVWNGRDQCHSCLSCRQYPLSVAKICTKSFKTQKSLLVQVAGLQTMMRRMAVIWCINNLFWDTKRLVQTQQYMS